MNPNTSISIHNSKNLTSSLNKKLIVRKSLGTDIPDYLIPEEVNEILESIPNNKQKHYLLIELLWKTGVRITEAINIKKKDIDFYNKMLKIQWLKKRKKLERMIPIHQTLLVNLSLFCGQINNDDYLFGFSRQRGYQVIKKYSVNIDKRVSPHVFRHSFAINFLKQTKNLVALNKLLGHSQIETTMIYLNIVKSDLQEEINKMEY